MIEKRWGKTMMGMDIFTNFAAILLFTYNDYN